MIKEWMNKIICGDSLELIKEIPSESIDLILTDPLMELIRRG